MTQLFRVHPDNPQVRLLRQAIAVLDEGGVVAFPTDSGYALGCRLDDKKAVDHIRIIRQLPEDHNFTLLCRNLSQLSSYAKISKNTFKMLKEYTPGPYTFILPATRSVPKRLQHPKRQTIGIRIPDHPIVQMFLDEINEPLMSVTLFLPGESSPITAAEDIYEKLNRQVDVIIDAGYCSSEPTTVIDFASNEDGTPIVIRSGKGNPNPFLAIEQKNDLRTSTFSQIFQKLQQPNNRSDEPPSNNN